jgi:multiple sugar transport system ATP-binding protein
VIATQSGLALHFNDQLQIPIPERQGSGVTEGQQVVMGLRTEDLKLDNGNGHLPADWKFQGEVDVVEPLGSETNMHMDLCGVKLVARSDGRRKISPGEKLLLALNLNHLHIFDAQSTLSIY